MKPVHVYNLEFTKLPKEQKETIKKLYPDRDVLFFEFAETEFRKKKVLDNDNRFDLFEYNRAIDKWVKDTSEPIKLMIMSEPEGARKCIARYLKGEYVGPNLDSYYIDQVGNIINYNTGKLLKKDI